MGIIEPYFPKETAIKLAKIAQANTFIETGTYYGGTAKWAADEFREIHTIELSEKIYNMVKDELSTKGNITLYLGDSRNQLPNILKNKSENIFFWLDGHYSGGITAGKEYPCPLINELEIILKRDNDDIILIDDARLYTGNEFGWPSIVEISKKVEQLSPKKRFMEICDDHIFILPDKMIYRELLLSYILDRNIVLWNENLKKNKKKLIFKRGVVKILKFMGLYNIAKKIYKMKKQ